VIVPAHPCRGWGRKHKHAHEFPREIVGRIAAIETLNGVNTLRSNEAAVAIAEEYGLSGTGGSDAHALWQVGKPGGSDAHALWQVGKCVTVFERDVTSEEELVEELREGRFTAAYLEDLRRKDQESA